MKMAKSYCIFTHENKNNKLFTFKLRDFSVVFSLQNMVKSNVRKKNLMEKPKKNKKQPLLLK